MTLKGDLVATEKGKAQREVHKLGGQVAKKAFFFPRQGTHARSIAKSRLIASG